jgi:branched-subunit amino acid transport protein AzlD
MPSETTLIIILIIALIIIGVLYEDLLAFLILEEVECNKFVFEIK